MTIRVVLACREEEHARALCDKLCRAAPAGTLVAQVARAGAAAEHSLRLPADVVLLEFNPLELQAGRAVLDRLADAEHSPRVLMLWDESSARSLLAFVHHGASGCLLTSSAPALYLKAIATVHAGETWFGRAELVAAIRLQLAAGPTHDAAGARAGEQLLTPRQREVLDLIGTGMSNKEIARVLAISDQTVKTHLHHIYIKLERSGRYKAFHAHIRHQGGPVGRVPGRLAAAGAAIDGFKPGGEAAAR